MMSPTKILIIASCLDMLGMGLLVPQLQPQAQKLGCSHLLVGAMGAVYSATQLISGPVIGNLSDLKGRKSTLLLTLLFCSAAYLALGFSSSIAIFFALRFFLGIFKQTQLLTKSMAPDYAEDPANHPAIFGKLATLSGIGMTIGITASGHVVEAMPDSGFQAIGVTLAVIYAVNTYLISMLPEKPKSTSNNEETIRKKKETIISTLIETVMDSFKESTNDLKKVNWAVYWDVLIYKLVLTLCMGMYFSNYAIFLKTEHNVGDKYLGYIIAFQGIITSFSTFYIGYINKFYKNDLDASLRNFHSFIGFTLSFIGMGLAPNMYLYVLFTIPLALSNAVCRVTSLEIIVNKGDDEHRGSVIGATESTRSISDVVTPLLVGIISEYIGVQYVVYFAAVISAAGMAVSYKIKYGDLSTSKRRSD